MVLEHDSNKIIYRKPFGAVVTGTKIRIRLSINSVGIPNVVNCIVNNNHINMYYICDINGSRIYECNIFMPDEVGLVFYYFYVEADGEKMFYMNNDLHLGGIGCSKYDKTDSLYQITVYDKDFKTPDWMKNTVIYQIFPDRFSRGDDTPFHGFSHNWSDEPFYLTEQFGTKYLCNDFFGGNFSGIKNKLDYLKDLGITAIYLNPISKAFSNHRYDTSDYIVPDETLGTVKDFEELSKHAKKLGIKIILDGVFSHTGADSRYFNKYGHFDSVGAYQSKDSKYYSWYNFTQYPDKYESWWGFETLPNVNELDESYINFIADSDDSVINTWLKRGASGFRLDVADELPDEFIKRLRSAIKKQGADNLLLGEVWEDASNKVSYGQQRKFLWGKWLDSVMNYVFRNAVLEYLLTSDSRLFLMRINSLLENYPTESMYSCMNLISSHDVPRALTVLSGAPDFRSMDRAQQHDYKINDADLSLAKQRMNLAVVLQMTMPGAPCIYYGDEVEMTGYADPFNRGPFDWSNVNCSLHDFTKKMANLRNSYDCLRTGDFKTVYYVNGTVCYMRSIENEKDIFGNHCNNGCILTIINSCNTVCCLELNLERFNVSEIHDVFTKETIEYNGDLSLCIEPLSFRILSLERNQSKCIKISNIQ